MHNYRIVTCSCKRNIYPCILPKGNDMDHYDFFAGDRNKTFNAPLKITSDLLARTIIYFLRFKTEMPTSKVT